MAKAKEKSQLERLAEAMKTGKTPKRVSRGPKFIFPDSKLAGLMKRLDLKVAAVAKEAGVDEHYVSAAMKGENVRVAQALKLAKVAGMSVEDLFGEPKEGVETASDATKMADLDKATVSQNESPPTEAMFPEAEEPNSEAQKL